MKLYLQSCFGVLYADVHSLPLKKILQRLKISFINKCLPFVLVSFSGEYLLIHSMNMCPLLLMNGYEVDYENSSDLFEDSLAFRK